MWLDQESEGGNFWKKEEEVGWGRDSYYEREPLMILSIKN